MFYEILVGQMIHRTMVNKRRFQDSQVDWKSSCGNIKGLMGSSRGNTMWSIDLSRGNMTVSYAHEEVLSCHVVTWRGPELLCGNMKGSWAVTWKHERVLSCHMETWRSLELSRGNMKGSWAVTWEHEGVLNCHVRKRTWRGFELSRENMKGQKI